MASSPAHRGRYGVFLFLVAVAVAARVLLLFILPPLLDVYYYDAQAVQALLAGANPYGHLFTGVPGWLATPGAEGVFVYLPAVVLFLAPFGAVWDVRLGLVAADLVVAWGILSLGGRWGRTASLVYLLAPFAMLFSTSYPNNTLVAMCFLGIFVVAASRGRRTAAGAALGASLAASQFVLFLYPVVLAWLVRVRRMREVAVSLATAALIVVPFFLWSPAAFLDDVVFFEFKRTTQGLVTQMAFGFNVNPTLSGLALTFVGVGVPLVLRAAAVAAAMVCACARTKDMESALLNGSWLVLFAVFVLPNDFSWWYLELPFQGLLLWLVLSRGGKAGPPAANA